LTFISRNNNGGDVDPRHRFRPVSSLETGRKQRWVVRKENEVENDYIDLIGIQADPG